MCVCVCCGAGGQQVQQRLDRQLQRQVLSPNLSSLQMICCRIMVLNAELKSMNSILTYEFFLSRWVRAGLRAEQIASSVDHWARYANWKGSRVGGEDGSDV